MLLVITGAVGALIGAIVTLLFVERAIKGTLRNLIKVCEDIIDNKKIK